MIGHKTNGDWTDVTSISRNQIVFEDRNREYGAYVISQRYNNSLALALLIASSLIAVVAALPFLIHLLSKDKVVSDIGPGIVSRPREYIEHFTQPVIPHTVLSTRPPAQSTRVTPPSIMREETIETIKTATSAATTDASTTASSDPVASDPGTSISNNPGIRAEPDKTIFIVVQKMPVFPGGDVVDYLGKNTNYPEEYRDANISGVVYYTFVVEADGTVSNVTILKGVAGGPELSNEVVRAIRSMPTWTPGMQNGHPVRVQYSGRIGFKLRD